jgi:membrane protein
VKRPQIAAPSESLWSLGGLTTRQLARNVFLDEIIANNTLGRAAELAYYYLFALFPLLLLMATLFGIFASHQLELQHNLLVYLADFVPRNAFLLLTQVAGELVANASGGKVLFGVLSALWFISSGVDSMISALNQAHHVREHRSWFKVRAIATGLSVMVSILLFAALFLAMMGHHFVHWFGKSHRWHPALVLLWQTVQWPAALVFVSISCSLIYHFGPDLPERPRWTWLTPGSAFAAVVWLAASCGFRLYLYFFNTYTATYGSLGAVMILLVWLYLTGLAYLIGGEINAEIERAAGRRRMKQATVLTWHPQK